MKNLWMTSLLLMLLAACGGGGSVGVSVSNPGGGTSNTGTSSGAITGFGSVFVNGTRYNTDNATVIRSGGQVSINDLAIGMVVTVSGDLDDDVAERVEYSESVEGPIDSISAQGILQVVGQTVVTDARTVFSDTTLNALNVGDVVEVSGLRNVDDHIVATFVELKTGTVNDYTVVGNVRDLDISAMTFQIDGLSVDYNSASLNDLQGGAPVENQLVEVKDDNVSYVPGSFELAATSVEGRQLFNGGAVSGNRVEIESIVSAVNSTSSFVIGGITVNTTASIRFLFGTVDNIIVGTRLEVEGTIDSSSVLQASTVKFEDNDVRLQGNVESVDVVNNSVVVLGVACQFNPQTRLDDNRDNVQPFTIIDIQVGDRLEIRGFIGSNARVIASEVERDNADNDARLRGPVSQIDATAGTISLLGLTININNGTELRGRDDNRVTLDQFLASTTEGLTIVQARWNPFTDTSLPVQELEIEE